MPQGQIQFAADCGFVLTAAPDRTPFLPSRGRVGVGEELLTIRQRSRNDRAILAETDGRGNLNSDELRDWFLGLSGTDKQIYRVERASTSTESACGRNWVEM